MYPVRLGHQIAYNRIQRLLDSGCPAEALLATMFTIEKTFRRVLFQLMISAGFTNAQAKIIMSACQGFDKIANLWPVFDPNQKSVKELVAGNEWDAIIKIKQMRNNLVHGNKVYLLKDCREQVDATLPVLTKYLNTFNNIYGFNGWTEFSIRETPLLHIDPKISFSQE